MKKRTYFLPVFLTLLMISCIVFLVVSLTRDPYAVAMGKGDSAMNKNDYHKAISQYTIAQTIGQNQVEPYLKALNAIVLSNDTTVVRDALHTINNCIEFCGTGSISDKQIVEAIDILIKNNNIQAAYDILNHLHFSYSDSEIIKEKFLILSQTPIHTENADNNENLLSTPMPTQVPLNSQMPYSDTTTSETQITDTPAPVKTQNPDATNAPETTPSASQKPIASPKASSEPLPTVKPESTPSVAATPLPTSSSSAPTSIQSTQEAVSTDTASQ